MRTWLKNLMVEHPELSGLVSDNIFPIESLSSSRVKGFPYLIIGLGRERNENLAEDQDHFAARQRFTVWIHDIKGEKGGSYVRVNEVINPLRQCLVNASNPELGVIRINYRLTSDELSDDNLKTCFRYMEFEAIIGRGSL